MYLVVHRPGALQQLPVRGPRGEVEGAREDEELAPLGAHDHGELFVLGGVGVLLWECRQARVYGKWMDKPGSNQRVLSMCVSIHTHKHPPTHTRTHLRKPNVIANPDAQLEAAGKPAVHDRDAPAPRQGVGLLEGDLAGDVDVEEVDFPVLGQNGAICCLCWELGRVWMRLWYGREGKWHGQRVPHTMHRMGLGCAACIMQEGGLGLCIHTTTHLLTGPHDDAGVVDPIPLLLGDGPADQEDAQVFGRGKEHGKGRGLCGVDLFRFVWMDVGVGWEGQGIDEVGRSIHVHRYRYIYRYTYIYKTKY